MRHCGELHVDAACVYLQYSCACRVLLRAGERRCFMHPHLMAVCLMWRYGGVQRYAISDTKASAIIKKLDELGISTKKISKTLTAQIGATSEKRPSRPSFSGHACFAVLAAFEDFLPMVLEARRGTRDQRVALVKAYRELLAAVSSKPGEEAGEGERYERIWEAFWSTPGKRAAQAAKAAARTFVKLLANVIPAEAMDSVYIHYLTCHIEEQIKAFGPL